MLFEADSAKTEALRLRLTPAPGSVVELASL